MKKIIPLLLTITLASPLQAQLFFPNKKANLAEAIGNARQIGLALFEFENEYGSFPNKETRLLVEEYTEKKIPADDKTSNDFFRQLFAAGITNSETMFFANIPGALKGEKAQEPAKALGNGQNAFTYISGLSTAGNPARPILLCPVIPGTTKFDPKPFGGKAIMMRIDISVTVHEIEDDGTLLIDGKDILSKDHPLWDGKPLDIRYPDIPNED